MEGTYPIIQAGQEIGHAAVTRQGLYYHFDCRCRLSGEVICRLTALCGEKSENLGIPVPQGGWFVLEKKLPVSRFGPGQLQIRVLPRHPDLEQGFVPIRPEEPFAYLARLKNAYLACRDGVTGIVLRE